MNWAEFFAMDGYALYVWPSYAIFVLALAWDALAPALKLRQVRRTLQLRLRREAQRTPA